MAGPEPVPPGGQPLSQHRENIGGPGLQGPPDNTAAQSTGQAQVRAALSENQPHGHQPDAQDVDHSEPMDYDMLNEPNLPIDIKNNSSESLDYDMLNDHNLSTDTEKNHSKPMDNDMLNNKQKPQARAGVSNLPNLTPNTTQDNMKHQSGNRFYDARVLQSIQVKPGTDHKDPTAVLQPTQALEATRALIHERIIPITMTDEESPSTNEVDGSANKFNTEIKTLERRQRVAIEESINIKKVSDVLLGGDKVYKEDDYSDKVMAQTQHEGSGVTTRAAAKEKEKPKETQGVWSTVINARNSLFSNFTGKNSNYKDESEVITNEEERQDTRNVVTFQTMCAQKREDEVVVRFQVLLAADYGFNSEKDKVFIRGLDVREKDPWKGDGVRMQVERKAPKSGQMSGITRMVGFTTLPKKVVGEQIPYKYIVVKEDQPIYEELRPEHIQHGVWNRILIIPHTFNAEYHDQLDDAIVMRHAHRLDYRKKATSCYLPSFKQIIKEQDFFNLKEMVERTANVFESHTTGILLKKTASTGFSYGETEPALKGYDKVCHEHARKLTNKLFEVMADVVIQIERSNGTISEITRLLEASTFLALFYVLCENKIHRFLPEISHDHLDLLVTALRPMLCESKCLKMVAIDFILNSSKKRLEISETFEDGLNKIVKSRAFKDHPEYIISILPVVHCLRGISTTISIADALREEKKSRFWGFFSLSNPSLVTAINSQPVSVMFSVPVFDAMKAWSFIDPLLKVSYLRCLQFDDFVQLLNNKERSDFWEPQILLAAATVWLNEDSVQNTSIEKLTKAMKACFLPQFELMREISETLDRTDVVDLELITKQATMATIKNYKFNQGFNSLSRVLEILVSIYSVVFAIGSLQIEGEAPDPLKIIVRASLEKVVKDNSGSQAMKLQTRCDKMSRLAKIFGPLEKDTSSLLLKSILTKCQEEVNMTKQDDVVIEAYTDLDEKSLHPDVKNILEERSFLAMDTPQNTNAINQLFNKAKSLANKWVLGDNTPHVSAKFASLAERSMNSASKQLDLRDKCEVLKFVLTSPAVNRIMENNLLVEHFSAKGKQLIKDLLTSFGCSIEEIVEGKTHIAMLKPLQNLRDSDIQSRMLYHNKHNYELASNCVEILRLRQQELEKYTESCAESINFLQLLNGRRNMSLQDAIAYFKTDAEIQSSVMESLWNPRQSKGQDIQVKIPFISKRAQKNITTFMRYNSSQTFRNLYEKHFNSGESSEDSSDEFLSAEDDDNEDDFIFSIKKRIRSILGQVVTPAITEFEDICKEINSCQLSLTKVDIHFNEFRKDFNGLKIELKAIANTQHFLQSHWTSEIYTKICQRLQMSEFKSTANMILRVKTSLGITSEFPEINKIVDTKEGREDSSAKLCSVSSEDIKIGELFKVWSKEDVRSIEELEKCQAVVKWLRDHMQSYQEFKFFVDLASISAGESDEEVDRVMFMQASVTAYSSFIFDLIAESSLEEFFTACQVLTNAMKLDSNLSEKLHDTNRHLPWIKTVKERHGSVETSSLQQVEAINKSGVYRVGLLSNLSLSYQQVEGQESKEYRKKLSQVDLDELRSKLMLISKSSESKEAVDKFTYDLQMAERLKVAGQSLYDSGCNLYRKMIIQVFCNPERKRKVEVDFGNGGLLFGDQALSKELPTLAAFLEKSLDDWNIHLEKLRNKFSSLNFFRTDQLVELSESIASCLAGEEMPMESNMILSLMAKDITSAEIQQAFKDILNNHGEDDIEVIKVSNEDIIQQLVQEYCLEDATAKASVMANKGERNLLVLSDWCLENQLEEDTIEELCNEYDKYQSIEKEEGVEPSQTFSEYTKHAVERASEEENATLEDKLQGLWKNFLESVETEHTADFLSFTCLGNGLQIIHESNADLLSRSYPEYLTQGKPNMVISSSEDIHQVSLTIYNHDDEKALPSMDEVLVCNDNTTREDVELICRRAFNDTAGKIFSVLYADKLDFNTSIAVENLFLSANIQNREYKLIFICCKDSVSTSYLATALDKYKTQMPQFKEATRIKTYLEKHLQRKGIAVERAPTSMRMIVSERAGMGKSLQIQRVSEELKFRQEIVELHDDKVDKSALISRWLRASSKFKDPTLFHVDITPAVGQSRNDLLFSLIVLGGIQDSKGKVWACNRKKDMYMFEMTDKSSKDFSKLLPKTTCLSPFQSLNTMQEQKLESSRFPIKERDSSNLMQLMDQGKFTSAAFQRPANYILRFFGNSDLDRYHYSPTDPPGSQIGYLDLLLNPRACPILDPSWAELTYFVSFLNFQLESCEKSIFCNQFQDEWQNLQFKKFVVKFMMHSSKDFATRSLEISDESDGRIPEISERRRWETSPHPYIFFNDDGITMSFFGICLDRNLNLVHPENPGEILEERIMTPNLYQLLKVQNHKDSIPMFNMNFDNLSKQDKLRLLCRVLGVEEDNLRDPTSPTGDLLDPDPTYKLTSDNVKKLLAMYMRFKTQIPVVCMGETGCGKTRMIKYLCDLVRGFKKDLKNMIVFKVHGGVTHETVKQRVTKAIEMAEVNAMQGIPLTVMFFDEANTTNAIGSIKEVMMDRLNDGQRIPETSTLQFICAVNPYRRHTDTMIKKLEGAGLGYHIKAENTKDTLGTIPLRQLVYRVHTLPLSMVPLVWDFGSVSQNNEAKYVAQMVGNVCGKLRLPGSVQTSLSQALQSSQEFMRKQQDECSFVSLRDVERALKNLEWFYSKIESFLPLMQKETQISLKELTTVNIAFLLAAGISYHARLEKERGKYARMIWKALNLRDQPEDILNVVVGACQDVFINELKLNSTIAKNTALKENVWMMVICIELKIPLFLVGKPGSSKSLAKTVVGDVMQGQNSYSQLFRDHFKEIHMVSFQCSPLATSEGIVGTFRQCQKYQQKKDLNHLTSVVILDEVGLAEDSPKMPLKALHPLLEDGCVDEDEPSLDKKVSFVGISNWALDPAKMNRGILLSRMPPDEHDLIKIGRGIGDKKYAQLTDPLVPDLVAGYLAVYNSQEREYFGLRDFYSLIKMISSQVKASQKALSFRSVELCVMRNFGGYFGDFHPSEVFLRQLKTMTRSGRCHSVSEKELIEDALSAREKTSQDCVESRYMLLLTKNNAALHILQMRTGADEREVIFGSSFPKDQEYSQICANINRIKMCMEAGKQVVLCNLETLYESLYDALNQQYSYMGGNRYVDLGLGTHRVKCRVHPNFRLILVAEDKDVYDKFPIPLINRLEKHYLGMETIMDPKYYPSVENLKQWVQEYCEVNIPVHERKRQKQFEPSDVFIGYHADVIPALVLGLTRDNPALQDEELEQLCKSQLMMCATPDSVVRLPDTKIASSSEDLFRTYFVDQNHDSLAHYIKDLPEDTNNLVQVTTHSRLLTSASQTELAVALDISESSVTLLSIQQFMSEAEFQKKLESYFQDVASGDRDNKRLLVAQIDAGDSKANNLVECAKYMIQGMALKWYGETNFNLLLVVHLPRVAGGCYYGYPGRPWKSVHIDELRSLQEEIPMRMDLLKDRSIYEILKAEADNEMGMLSLDKLVECVVPKSASMIKGTNLRRQMTRIDKFLMAFRAKSPIFKKITLRRLVDLLAQKDHAFKSPQNWLSRMSLYNESLKEGNTFREAVWSHLQDYIAGPMAQLMAFIDTNDNLDFVVSKIDWKKDLFMRLYREVKIETITESKEVWIKNQGPSGNTFKLPFSWILINLVTCCSQQSGGDVSSELLKTSKEGIVLMEAFEAEGEAIMTDYIADLMQLSIDTNKKKEIDFLSNSMLSYVKDAKEEVELMQGIEVLDLSKDEEAEVSKQNVGPKFMMSPLFIHNQYMKIKEQMIRFTAILRLCPEALPKIQEICKEKRSISIDLAAVMAVMEQMSPNFDSFVDDTERTKWEDEADKLQSLVNQIITEENTDDAIQAIRFQWHRILIIRLFLHHVFPLEMDPHLKISILPKVKSMWMYLKTPDLKTHATFKNVIQLLKIVNIQAAKLHYTGGVNECAKCAETPRQAVALPCGHVACEDCLKDFINQRVGEKRCPAGKCKNPIIPVDFEVKSTLDIEQAVKKHSEFRATLNLFFMDVVENFCFNESKNPPEDKVLDALLDFVTIKAIDEEDKLKTKELSPFNEHGVDTTPVIRSFILQLCMKCDQRQASYHIQAFLDHKKRILPSEEESIELAQLYINCAEDLTRQTIFKAEKNTDSIMLGTAIQALDKHNAFRATNFSDVQTLDAVAEIRLALCVVAQVLSTALLNLSQLQHQLLEEAVRFVDGNEFAKEFLVKEVCLKHRSDTIAEMKKHPGYSKLLPLILLVEEDNKEDRFLVSGDIYLNMKSQLLNGVINNQLDDFCKYLENNPDNLPLAPKLMISLYFLTDVQTKIDTDGSVRERLSTALQPFQPAMYRTPKASEFLNWTLKKNLGALHRMENNESKRALEIKKLAFCMRAHLSAVQSPTGLSELCSKLMFNPETQSTSYLPTMPHDEVYEALQEVGSHGATKGGKTVYYCSNNHPYYIGECGQAIVTAICICGALIGGSGHTLDPSNRPAGVLTDQTRQGYILAKVEDSREGVRGLTAFDVNMQRLLIHVSLLAALVDKPGAVSMLVQVPEQNIATHMITLIDRGIKAASRQVGKSQDDIILLLFSITINMIETQDRRINLTTHVARTRMEAQFAQEIRGSLGSIETIKEEYSRATTADESQTIGSLHSLLTSPASQEGSRRLWQVRHQVTADHLQEWLLSTGQADQAPTLLRFLGRGEVVDCLPSLPTIIQLHTQLVERFNRTVSLTELEDMTVREFITAKIDEPSARTMVASCEVLLDTWNRLSSKVKAHGGARLAAELARLDQAESGLDLDNTPASFLFPGQHGRGLCSLSLARLLTDTHNSLVASPLPPLAPSKATVAHLAALTSAQVQSLLLAHTRHSLEAGGALRESYDIQAMERKVKDRFVRGKPRLLEEELPRILFLEDRSRCKALLATQIPQERLSNSSQHQLETEARTLPELCRLLDSVLTARDFLLEAGGESARDLPAFLARLRLYQGDPGAGQGSRAVLAGPLRGLQLCHVDSLVDFLLFVRAKRMIRNRQNVFEQVIPLAYQVALPKEQEEVCRETLTRLPHAWLLPNLFSLIWTRLREEPLGETSQWPLWPLKVMLASHVESGEEQCELLPDEVLVQHSVAFFLGLNHVISNAIQ